MRIEGTRLHFIKCNQQSLRSKVYNNLTDYLEVNRNADGNIGRRVILPSSFTGSPRNMYQNYLDAMCIVRQFGKPSLFITMTCNPQWPEIIDNIDDIEAANFRPEIIIRVFKVKLKESINVIVNKSIFGRVVALIYTIEFQKRGLPHAHILITLHENDAIVGTNNIDKVVSAEIPDVNENLKLHEYVKKHMMHGPCGQLNLQFFRLFSVACVDFERTDLRVLALNHQIQRKGANHQLRGRTDMSNHQFWLLFFAASHCADFQQLRGQAAIINY